MNEIRATAERSPEEIARRNRLFEDPFALFDNDVWVSMLKNHPCIQEVQTHFQPIKNVDSNERKYIQHGDIMERAYRAGLELDTPNLRDEFGYETMSGIDRSFSFTTDQNTGVSTILWVFRFAEEGLDGETATRQNDEVVDLSELDDPALNALIEERVFVKLLLMVHPDDVEIVRDQYVRRIKPDDNASGTIKERLIKRSQTIDRVKVKFVLYFFV